MNITNKFKLVLSVICKCVTLISIANLFLVMSLFNILHTNAFCEESRTPIIKCEINGFIDFNAKKIWLQSSSVDKMLICLIGSTISLDDSLQVDNNNNYIIKPYNLQQGCQWLMMIPSGKPSIFQGIDIKNFNKTHEYFNKKGFIEISAPVYRLTRDGDFSGKFSGPYILDKKIRVIMPKAEDIDNSRLLLIPIK